MFKDDNDIYKMENCLAGSSNYTAVFVFWVSRAEYWSDCDSSCHCLAFTFNFEIAVICSFRCLVLIGPIHGHSFFLTFRITCKFRMNDMKGLLLKNNSVQMVKTVDPVLLSLFMRDNGRSMRQPSRRLAQD